MTNPPKKIEAVFRIHDMAMPQEIVQDCCFPLHGLLRLQEDSFEGVPLWYGVASIACGATEPMPQEVDQTTVVTEEVDEETGARIRIKTIYKPMSGIQDLIAEVELADGRKGRAAILKLELTDDSPLAEMVGHLVGITPLEQLAQTDAGG